MCSPRFSAFIVILRCIHTLNANLFTWLIRRCPCTARSIWAFTRSTSSRRLSRFSAALTAALRAITQSVAPLMAALAARWIRDGSAAALRDGVRAEAEARQALARRILPPGGAAHPGGLHVWQTLPRHWDRAGLIAAARALGLGLMPSDAFAVDAAAAPDAVRLSLGAIPDRVRLKAALEALSGLMARRP